jgi:arsenate reductase-like glutaredoxin family protein
VDVQIYGTRKSSDTRKALRFFSERRIKTHFVDLDERPMSPGELKRFVDRFGIDALVDRDSRRFAELGLSAASPSKDLWVDRLIAEPALLRQPLVRQRNRLSLGLAETEWKVWCATPT